MLNKIQLSFSKLSVFNPKNLILVIIRLHYVISRSQSIEQTACCFYFYTKLREITLKKLRFTVENIRITTRNDKVIIRNPVVSLQNT